MKHYAIPFIFKYSTKNILYTKVFNGCNFSGKPRVNLVGVGHFRIIGDLYGNIHTASDIMSKRRIGGRRAYFLGATEENKQDLNPYTDEYNRKDWNDGWEEVKQECLGIIKEVEEERIRWQEQESARWLEELLDDV